MQATVHLMTGLAAYPTKSPYSSLAIARINDHHHHYGSKIDSDDVIYLMIYFGLAPVPWINKSGWRKLEPFEMHAIWTVWRELACRMDVKYIPETLEKTDAWRWVVVVTDTFSEPKLTHTELREHFPVARRCQ